MKRDGRIPDFIKIQISSGRSSSWILTRWCAEWPGEQSTEPQLEEESAPPVGVVVTAEDFRRLKLMIRAVRGRTRFGEYPNVLERKLPSADHAARTNLVRHRDHEFNRGRVFDAMTGSTPLSPSSIPSTRLTIRVPCRCCLPSAPQSWATAPAK